MSRFSEVKIYDVKNLETSVYRSAFCKNAFELQLLVRNGTDIPKERQLLLWQGKCLISMNSGCFKDVVPRDTVYLFDLESPTSHHKPEVATAEVPENSDNVEVYSRNCAVYSRCMLRGIKKTKETQRHLIDAEYHLRIYVQSCVIEILPPLSDLQILVEERLKRINGVKDYMPDCSVLNAQCTKYLEIKEALLSYKLELKQMLEELKIAKKFVGCQDNCCVEKFQRSVSEVDQSHKRISCVSQGQDEDVIGYTREHASADIQKKCRAMSQHINTHCQDKLVELREEVQREVRSHLSRRETIENIKAYIDRKELNKEDHTLDKLLNKRASEIYNFYTCNLGPEDQESECTHL